MNPLSFELLDSPRIRIGALAFFLFLGLSILVIRLWKMQVVDNMKYEEKSQKQSVRAIRVPPVRGRILARDGTPLVENRVSWDVKLHLAELRGSTTAKTIGNVMAAAESAAARIGRKNPLTKEAVQRHMNYYPGIPLELFTDLTNAEHLSLAEQLPRIPGLEITAEPVRSYPQGAIASQIIGYTGPLDPNEAEDRGDYFYYIASLRGKSGLERLFDEKLRGMPGSRLALVNSAGFVHEYVESEETEAQNGFDLCLTLDLKAQKTAERLLRGRTGAIVLLNAENGEVLAMASAPTFDPRLFVPRISAQDYAALTEDPGHPFLNRAVMGSYMPGSIIKPLTALAALKAGINPSETFVCTGKVPYGYSPIHCMNNAVHGPLNMLDALKRSCNSYFVTMGMRTGIDTLSAVFSSAGLGKPTGWLMRESRGHCPSNSGAWRPEETAYVSFGQGRVEVTPLQAALYTAAIANGGTLWKPVLLSHIYDSSSGSGHVSVFDAVHERNGQLDAAPEALATVREGMRRVVWENGGSGKGARTSKIVLYGKTGTADVVVRGRKYKNAWFIGFGRDPKTRILYAIAVLIEHGESGGRTAAPVAGAFFEEFL